MRLAHYFLAISQVLLTWAVEWVSRLSLDMGKRAKSHTVHLGSRESTPGQSLAAPQQGSCGPASFNSRLGVIQEAEMPLLELCFLLALGALSFGDLMRTKPQLQKWLRYLGDDFPEGLCVVLNPKKFLWRPRRRPRQVEEIISYLSLLTRKLFVAPQAAPLPNRSTCILLWLIETKTLCGAPGSGECLCRCIFGCFGCIGSICRRQGFCDHCCDSLRWKQAKYR
jgi:hypothetical protein